MTLETATLFHDSPYAKTLVTFVNSFRITENTIFVVIAFISFEYTYFKIFADRY